MDIKEFPQGVAELLDWYVYRLIDPRDGCTFYVGKGRGNRVFSHMLGEVDASDDDELLGNKLRQIREIRLAGLEVIHVIHRHGMNSEKMAFEVEAALIDAYPGLTNIMNGVGSSEYGVAHIKELIALYKPETVEFAHRVLMISTPNRSRDVSLYDAVRYAWKVNVARAEQAEFILATVKGIVRGVFVATQWLPALEVNFPTLRAWGEDPEQDIAESKRHGFIGYEAPAEISALYMGKRVPDEYRKRGAMSPLKYSPGL